MNKLAYFLITISITINSNAQTTDTAFVQVDDATKLFTVLSQPASNSNSLVLIIPGSGPTDHNGNSQFTSNNSLLFLSNALVENNIATLRYDKRGVANSSSSDYNEADDRTERFAADVVGLIKYARKKGFEEIFVIGHSEGSLLGLIAAQQEQLSGFISLSGAGNSIDKVLKNQLGASLPAGLYNQSEQIIDSLKAGYKVNNIPPKLAPVFRPSVQPYLISWMKYNPAELIEKLTCPTIIINGTKDLQTPLSEAEILAAASDKNKLVVVEDMNHVLKNIKGSKIKNIKSYNNPKIPIHTELPAIIVEFIKL